MSTICTCGCDCSEFLTQHAIPAGGRFSCPACELPLSAAAESPATASLIVTDPTPPTAALENSAG